MNLTSICLTLSLVCGLFTACDKKSEEVKSSAKSQASAAKSPSTPASKTLPSTRTKSVTSPAEQDAKALKALDFPAVKQMAIASKAKLTMVPVWATWCVPCIKEMPHLAEFFEKHHEEGLNIIGMCVGDTSDEDDADKMAEKIAELKSPFHHYVLEDSKAETFFKAFGEEYGGTLPATIVLDAKGEVVLFTRNGWTDDSLNKLIVPKLK